MAKKMVNKLKAKKFMGIDKVARRTIKAQEKFDEAADCKRRKACERGLTDAHDDNRS